MARAAEIFLKDPCLQILNTDQMPMKINWGKKLISKLIMRLVKSEVNQASTEKTQITIKNEKMSLDFSSVTLALEKIKKILSKYTGKITTK